MSVCETNVIDIMAQSKENSMELKLVITDHLDWEEEQQHLLMLQEKINTYLGFIEAKEYMDTYRGLTFESFLIDIRFKYIFNDSCHHFLNIVASQFELMDISIRLRAEISEE